MSLIHVEHLRKEYEDVTPLKDVSFDVNEGDVISIIGPSGTGKSTLLRCINLLEQPTSGTIVVDGDEITSPRSDVARIRRKMGMVFQSFNLFDNLDVLGNVCVAPIRLLRMPADEARREALELLARVGIADKAGSFPSELSGGQMQRVAIARAIAMKPKVLLLDEPTSALDPTMIAEVLGVIRSLASGGMTMMIVTHELQFARSVSNRVFYMDVGGLYEEGTPQQVFEHPKRERTRRFVRRLKTWECQIETLDPSFSDIGAQVERFGASTGLSQRQQRNVLLAFEELVFQCVLPELRRQGSGLPVKVAVEHAEADGEVSMDLAWGGAPFDPLAEGDDLSVSIVRQVTREVSYRHADQNRLTLRF